MWIVQRIGWGVLAAIVLASFFGLFGLGGWVSSKEESASWGSIRYDRFLRWQGPTSIELQIRRSAVKNDEFEIWISNDYLRKMKTETFFPVPKAIFVQEDRSYFVFDVRPGEKKGGFPLFLLWQAEEIGSYEGRIGLSGEERSFDIRQVVYP